MDDFLVFGVQLLMYLAMAMPLWVIAGKRSCGPRWFAFVPLLNMALLAGLIRDSDAPDWLLGVGLIIALFVPLVGWIATGWAWAQVAENVQQPAVIGWLAGIPLIGLIAPAVIAYRTSTSRSLSVGS